MPNPFKSKEFRELEKKWYSKLSKKGFKDIERTDRVGKENQRLKTDVMENIMHFYTVDQFNIKQEYYRTAGLFLHEHKFKSAKEKKIWALHSEGLSIRDIIKLLKSKGQVAYKDLVQNTIKRLAAEMKKNVRER
jgi:hypothetical protein